MRSIIPDVASVAARVPNTENKYCSPTMAMPHLQRHLHPCQWRPSTNQMVPPIHLVAHLQPQPGRDSKELWSFHHEVCSAALQRSGLSNFPDVLISSESTSKSSSTAPTSTPNALSWLLTPATSSTGSGALRNPLGRICVCWTR